MSDDLFQREDGVTIPAVSFADYQSVLSSLRDHHHLHIANLSEGPAYSFAMVVRFALGLSAEGGLICAIVRDTLPGAIAVHCLRHLVNGGSNAVILVLEKQKDDFQYLKGPLAIAETYGIQVEYWNDPNQTDLVQDVIGQCHNVLFGAASTDSPSAAQTDGADLLTGAVSLLNELSTPVHCVFAPLGFNLETGQRMGEALFASSTLSLGIPLRSLLQHPDLLGRHYLADLSVPLATYQTLHEGCTPPFSEQPVVQIFPKQEEEASD